MVGFTAAALPGQRVAQRQPGVESLIAFQRGRGQPLTQTQIAQAQSLLRGSHHIIDALGALAVEGEYRTAEPITEMSKRVAREPVSHGRA